MGDILGKQKEEKRGGGGGAKKYKLPRLYTIKILQSKKEHETYQVDCQGENHKDLYPLTHYKGEGIPG